MKEKKQKALCTILTTNLSESEEKERIEWLLWSRNNENERKKVPAGTLFRQINVCMLNIEIGLENNSNECGYERNERP